MSNRFIKPSFAALLLLAGTHLYAQNCRDPQTQLAMNQCAARDYEREDASLNKNYKNLLDKTDASQKEALRDVQRSWLVFRDKECNYQSKLFEGGSMYSMVMSSCLTNMTRQRNKDLKYLMEDTER